MSMGHWKRIRDGGQLLFEPDFYSSEKADELFDWLQTEIPWRQESIFGKPAPRLNAWFAEEGLEYAYSGLSHVGEGWLPELMDIKKDVEVASAGEFNSLLLNLYRNGDDSIGFHSDAEPELGENPVVATLSLGSPRDFVLRHRDKKDSLTYHLTHGSLLIMGGASQHHWLHAVPKTKKAVGIRISLTFRLIRG